MTLTRLVLAWALTAGWFVIATRAIAALVAWLAVPAGQTGPPPAPPPAWITWRAVEAALVTLFAALWFHSLGSGGWWLVFLLVGALATIPMWLRARGDQPPRQALVVGACADIGRYVVAGAVLAWRLG